MKNANPYPNLTAPKFTKKVGQPSAESKTAHEKAVAEIMKKSQKDC